mmetsp:Transcript_110287/g.355712  ORF Transcript_110287/g.355712 Transcript_110287/m.355712 type:complete len:116 (+) Transcript_110287:59-406(+)
MSVASGNAKSRRVAKRLTCPFINTRIINAADSWELDLLIDVIVHFLPEMNLVNVTTALHRLAKMVSDYSPSVPSTLLQKRHCILLSDLLSAILTALLKSEGRSSTTVTRALSTIL